MHACKNYPKYARALLVAFGMMFGAASASAVEIAASIQYEFVKQPDGLSDEFKATESASPKFLTIKAIDGFQINAVMWQPKGKQPSDTTAIIMIHGSGDSYRSQPQSALGARFAAKGYAALAIDTRQHDDKINTDNFFDVRRDIDAAVQTARALGYRTIVLQGHSLGNIQVQFYAATNWDRDIKAVVLLGAFGNLPWKSRTILVQNETNFMKLVDASKKSLREGTVDKVLPVQMQYYTGHESPVTAQHFLTYRWDKTSVADGTFWIRRIPLPILLVRDQADALIQPFEPYMLLDSAHSEGTLVTSIDYVLLSNANPPSLRSHSFVGNEQPLADSITKWLADRGL
jgi:pimeloyl-ACP methyl ester carboxylesterase